MDTTVRRKLTRLEVILIIVTSLMVVGYLYYTFEYEKQTKRMAQAQSDLQALNTNVASYQMAMVSPQVMDQTLLKIRNVEEEMEQLRAEIDRTKLKMKEKNLDILQQLKREAQLHGAVLRSFKSQERDRKRGNLGFREVSVIMKIHSDYASLIRFIQRLDEIPAVLSLRGFETQRRDDILPLVETRLQIDFFVL